VSQEKEDLLHGGTELVMVAEKKPEKKESRSTLPLRKTLKGWRAKPRNGGGGL